MIVPPAQKGLDGLSQALRQPVKPHEGSHHKEQKRQVLDRDEFAVLLGQGPTLEHQLRRIEEELKQRNEIDRSIPTLVERIGRLEVLNERERQAMRNLGLHPKEPPLVLDIPARQLREGGCDRSTQKQ